VRRQREAVSGKSEIRDKVRVAREMAQIIADEDAEWCRRIGEHGLPLVSEIFEEKGGKEPVNILTHCNAGWLAFVDYGSATAPIYAAHDAGIPVHVWVDETRPRNQGGRLTAWELEHHGVPHTVIVDNTGGHLMQHGMVDLVITGTDRTTHTGDVANKIGTYLKALAAKDNGIPFYVALPSSTIDWETRDGVQGIPIEERAGDEITMVSGITDGKVYEETSVWVVSPGSAVANYAFDVTPSRLVTGLITERGICAANESSIHSLFPEK
ncbi:MAG: S-methyl-5-thioribose-1-phosphate isomerase, partial [Verrucomicrobiota bacterium]